MVRGYLNNLSFPAATLDDALELLTQLRSGMAMLLRQQLMTPRIMCTWRVAELQLTPDYETLRDAAKINRGRFRDTIQFFLQLLDQRSPSTAELSESDQAEADPHIVEGLGEGLEPVATTVLVACALDGGALLSIASGPRWAADHVDFTLLTEATTHPRSVSVENVCDATTGEAVAMRLIAARHEFVFDNWAVLTGGAVKSEQIDSWFAECRRVPGLEAAIMRSLNRALQSNYATDGALIKKLTGATTALFEIRIYRSGPVRILFVRDDEGRAVYGYGGTKTAGNTWYDHAVPQAQEQIARLRGQ